MDNLIPDYIARRLSPDGYLKSDPRFQIEEEMGALTVTFRPDDGGRPSYHRSHDWVDALTWMTEQAPPNGSLRLGSLVASATKAMGIPSCGPCRARQLEMNNIGKKRS